MLVLEEQSLLLVKKQPEKERQILVYTDQASYVKVCLEAFQRFIFHAHSPISSTY